MTVEVGHHEARDPKARAQLMALARQGDQDASDLLYREYRLVVLNPKTGKPYARKDPRRQKLDRRRPT